MLIIIKKFIVGIAFICLAGQANATLINLDFSALGLDDYSIGPAVFGSANSQWNIAHRSIDHVNLALFDDTGAPTSVTVTTNRISSGSLTPSPANIFAALGMSFQISDLVLIGGLAPFTSYDLAIYFNTVPSSNFNLLTDGINYSLLTNLIANVSGVISFVPTGPNPFNDDSPIFTAFQLQTSPSAIPIPAAIWLFGSTLITLLGVGLRRK